MAEPEEQRSGTYPITPDDAKPAEDSKDPREVQPPAPDPEHVVEEKRPAAERERGSDSQ
jgi:hypothetical protein